MKIHITATLYQPKRPRKHEVLITVDVAKVEADYSQDSNFYVSPGGGGAAIGNRYKQFQQWLIDNPDTPIDPPDMGWSGHVACFGDGRHRWAVLRDQGAKRIAVTIPRRDLKIFVERYGAELVDGKSVEV
jgi:hypothetical protein